MLEIELFETNPFTYGGLTMKEATKPRRRAGVKNRVRVWKTLMLSSQAGKEVFDLSQAAHLANKQASCEKPEFSVGSHYFSQENARTMCRRLTERIRKQEVLVRQVIICKLTGCDIGIGKQSVTWAQAMKLAHKHGYGELPDEAVLQLRMEYQDQPPNEELYVAMEPVRMECIIGQRSTVHLPGLSSGPKWETCSVLLRHFVDKSKRRGILQNEHAHVLAFDAVQHEKNLRFTAKTLFAFAIVNAVQFAQSRYKLRGRTVTRVKS